MRRVLSIVLLPFAWTALGWATPARADLTPPVQRPPDWDQPDPPPPDPPPEKEPLVAALGLAALFAARRFAPASVSRRCALAARRCAPALVAAARRTLHEAPRCSTSTV